MSDNVKDPEAAAMNLDQKIDAWLASCTESIRNLFKSEAPPKPEDTSGPVKLEAPIPGRIKLN